MKPNVLRLIADALEDYRDQDLAIGEVEIMTHAYDGECIELVYREYKDTEEGCKEHIFIISVEEKNA